MRPLPRVTTKDFYGKFRGFGFSDCHVNPVVPAGFDNVRAIGPNCIRSAVVAQWSDSGFVIPGYQFKNLTYVLREAQARSMYVLVVLVVAEHLHEKVWNTRLGVNSLVGCCSDLAKFFKGRTALLGIQILNEPKLFVKDNQETYWGSYVPGAVAAITSVDTRINVVIQTWPGGLISSKPEYGDLWRPQKADCVMSGHAYSPFAYTHADMMPHTTPGESFDPIATLNKTHEEFLAIRAESEKYGVPVFITETSTRQDRKGAELWAAHTLQLCEGFEFSWIWHYFYGDSAWHPNEATLEVLKKFMLKNRA